MSHRLLESDLTGKLNNLETKLDAVNDKGTTPSGDADKLHTRLETLTDRVGSQRATVRERFGQVDASRETLALLTL